MSTATPRRATRYSTRLLLSVAAVGAAGGILVVALNYALAAIPPSSLAYSIYTATIGAWFLGPLVAMALFRLPGVAFLATLFTGIINLIAPAGVSQLTVVAIGGVLLELPFLVALYRRWSDGFFRIAYPVALLVMSALYLVSCLMADVIRPDEFWPWLAVGTAVLTAIEVVVLTWGSMRIAARLRLAGLGTRSTDRVAVPAEPAAQSPADAPAEP